MTGTESKLSNIQGLPAHCSISPAPKDFHLVGMPGVNPYPKILRVSLSNPFTTSSYVISTFKYRGFVPCIYLLGQPPKHRTPKFRDSEAYTSAQQTPQLLQRTTNAIKFLVFWAAQGSAHSLLQPRKILCLMSKSNL